MLTGEAHPQQQKQEKDYKPAFSDLHMPVHLNNMSAAGGQYGDDLMNALKDLDDFFNEDGEPASPTDSNHLYMVSPGDVSAGSSVLTTPNNI